MPDTDTAAPPTLSAEDQARGYWIAAQVKRRNVLPGDVADNLRARGELDQPTAHALADQSLCVLGAETTLPRLRRRLMAEWRELVPTAPAPQPEPPGAA